MGIKQLKASLKDLDSSTRKVNSAYWGKTWWDVHVQTPTVFISFQFEENQPIQGISIVGKQGITVTADGLRKTAEILTAIAEIVDKSNS